MFQNSPLRTEDALKEQFQMEKSTVIHYDILSPFLFKGPPREGVLLLKDLFKR